jgi:hypothetical protein
VYKGVFNFRLGGELKFKTIMARAGFAYYTDPYKDEELKGRKMFISGGLGYRNKGMFIDLTYVQRLNKDVTSRTVLMLQEPIHLLTLKKMEATYYLQLALRSESQSY